MRRRHSLTGLGIAVALLGAACGSSDTSSSSSGGSAGTGSGSASSSSSSSTAAAGKIALLLPESKTARYESADKPLFLAELQAKGYNTSDLIYSNANQDATQQQNQADAAISNGAKVLVLDAVDTKAAAAIADKAKAAGIPVLAYDRLIQNSDGVQYFVSFDNPTVGKLQAQALVDKLTALGKTKPTIVMINGSPTDSNAGDFKAGAHSVFDPLVAAGKLTIAKEYDTPDWSPDQAQNEMQQALTALQGKVDGVYCANDGTGGGAIAAMKAANISPLPPVTGQDAEVAGLQRIISNDQFMTIYKAIKPEAIAAADAALALASGGAPDASVFKVKKNNGKADVLSDLLTPVAVTKDNLASTVVADGFHTAAEICTATYADKCAALGIK